ncbi:MAG TPA: hypothetical protein VLW85_12770 [Myxococcales bacterium]|nr:hypothetical protein [Myxococcales bacterium]
MARVPTEQELMAEAQAVIQPLPPVEPRPGFAAMVALNARDELAPPVFGDWLRWSLGGLALAGAAAVAVVAVNPRPHRSHDVMVAQRLEMLEDMTVMQNQQALEDLDVVAVLDKLEARP